MQTYETAPQRGGLVQNAMREGKAKRQPPSDKGGVEKAGGGSLPQGSEPLQRVVLAAMKLMYEEKTSGHIVRMLKGGNPAQALAQAGLFVMKVLFDLSQKKIPPNIIIPASLHVLKLLAELALASGVKLSIPQMHQAQAIVQQRLQQRFGGGQTQPPQPQPQQAQQPQPQAQQPQPQPPAAAAPM